MVRSGEYSTIERGTIRIVISCLEPGIPVQSRRRLILRCREEFADEHLRTAFARLVRSKRDHHALDATADDATAEEECVNPARTVVDMQDEHSHIAVIAEAIAR
jgi:hypothetical protein